MALWVQVVTQGINHVKAGVLHLSLGE